MHITCVICSDLFTPSADIYTTTCGHIFHYTCLLHWLENSKTCPQCRTKCSSKTLIRLYVNLSTSQGLEADVTVLQHKLDGVEFSMKLKDKEIRNVATKNKEISEQNKLLRGKIKELELEEKRYESIVAAHKEQIKYFKGQAQSCTKFQDEIIRLKSEVRNLEHVQVAVNGSRQQVDEIIRNENSVESLALLAATLKKSLIDTDRRKKELQYELKKTQNELSQHKRKMTEIKCEYEDAKRQLESLKLNYDKEVQFLKDKFSQLQGKATKSVANDSLNDSIRRITSESPVNYNRTPVLSGFQDDCGTLPLDKATCKPKRNTVDDDIIEIIESPLPASSMGLYGIQKAKRLGCSADYNKFSIFKNKPAIPSAPVPVRPSYRGSELTYDGFGGSSKEDVFPSPVGVKRLKTGKFKKLSAAAGKPNRKMSDFLNQD